jgi:uncharacterized protein YukE
MERQNKETQTDRAIDQGTQLIAADVHCLSGSELNSVEHVLKTERDGLDLDVKSHATGLEGLNKTLHSARNVLQRNWNDALSERCQLVQSLWNNEYDMIEKAFEDFSTAISEAKSSIAKYGKSEFDQDFVALVEESDSCIAKVSGIKSV